MRRAALVAVLFAATLIAPAPAEAYGRSYFGSLYGTSAHCSTTVVNNTCAIGHRHRGGGKCNSYVQMKRTYNRYIGWVVYSATLTGVGQNC